MAHLIILMMIKINDFDLGTNLLDEKLYKNILTYHAAYKTPYNEKPYLLFLIKQVEIWENMMVLNT